MKNRTRQLLAIVFLIIILLLGVYCGWWLVFLKPMIAIVTTSAVSWSAIGMCVLRFFGADILCDFIWLVGYVIYVMLRPD